MPMTIDAIARELNCASTGHEIGRLPQLRGQLKSQRPASRTIFDGRTIQEDWAFHVGGRSELQFNIGLEDPIDGYDLRHGVGFSLERSRSFPDEQALIATLLPKIRRFNDFVAREGGRYSDLRMWTHTGIPRSRTMPTAPVAIVADSIMPGAFIFLGGLGRSTAPDYERILRDFDRLLPLYLYTEGGGEPEHEAGFGLDGEPFQPGHRSRSHWTTATHVERTIDISLRHNAMQDLLYDRLAAEYGAALVRTEKPGPACRIDATVATAEGYRLYEIKTSDSPKACIREALGQLLEYSLWPGAAPVIELVVVGEAPLTAACRDYLATLNRRFPLPLRYEQLTLPG